MRGGGGATMLFFWLIFIRDGETVVFLIFQLGAIF